MATDAAAQSGVPAGRQPRPQDLRWNGGTTRQRGSACSGGSGCGCATPTLGNQCTVTGRLVVFTMVEQEPLRCPGSAWAAAAARW
jgi:hypothetical protein